MVSCKNISWDEMLAGMNELFEADNIQIEELQALMESYRSNKEDWKQFSMFDEHKYTRNLVSNGNGKYNLIVLCWGEGMASSIHDHPDSHCMMKVLDGTLKESLYSWPDHKKKRPMALTKETEITANDVAYIADSIGLHRIENPSHIDKAVSLHLYCPPFDMCSTFDQNTGKRKKVGITFWSQYGERTPFGVNENGCAEAANAPENN